MTTPPFARSTDSHPNDGVLLALLDREREDMLDAARDAELASGRTHLEHCDDCRARLAVVAAQSGQVRAALASIPVPPVTVDTFRRRLASTSSRQPVPLWRRPAWQAAAAVIVVAGAAAATTSPIRAWIRHRAERATAEQRASAPPLRGAPPQAVDRSGATVSFAATGPELIVRFDSLPEAGVLTVDSATTGEITVRVVSGAGTGGDAIVVLPRELHVRNSTRSRAGYAVSVPSIVTRLRVIVAEKTVFDGTPRVVVPLRPRR